MMRLARWAAGCAMLVAAGSCATIVPSPEQRGDDQAAQAPQPAPAPVPVPTPTPTPTPPPARTGFSYDGDMIQSGMVIGRAPSDTVSLIFDDETQVPVTEDGRFLIAFDRNHDAKATLVATLADGSKVSDTLAIAKRHWDLQRLSSLPKHSRPSAEYLKLRKPELARIHGARAKRTGADGWRQDFVWPATGRLSSPFGSQRIYKNNERGSYHTGVDIAVPTGTPVRAPANGTVILAAKNPFTLEGKLLMIDHGMGLNSAFLHLSRIDVSVGDHVRRGEVVAETGSSGRATGPHLHYGLKWRDARIDPVLVTGPMPEGG